MRNFLVTNGSFIGGSLVPPGAIVSEVALNGATPGEALVEVDDSGKPVNDADLPRLLHIGSGFVHVPVAPVSPHAPNPTRAQAVPGHTPGAALPLAGDRGYVPAEGVESNEAAAARVERLKRELAEATAMLEGVEDLEPEPPQRRGEQEPGLLDQSVPKLIEDLDGISDTAEIDRLIAAETAGKSRTSALDALQARRDELTAE